MQNSFKQTDKQICMHHSIKGVVCTSGWSKFRGLMFSKRKTLIFEFKEDTNVPLHMLFVFFPIDVLFLNEKKTVLEVKKNFMPFTFYSPKHKARYVIEIPSPTDFAVGDVVTFK